jgi:rhamnosyltransferase subunit B
MLFIAKILADAGYEVLFLAAERYLHLAHRAGLETRALVSEAQFSRLSGDPRLWHPRHGVKLIFQEAVGQFLDEHLAWLERSCDPQRTMLVSHMLDLAGRIYRDLHPETRMVSALPAPALLRSRIAPPRLSGFWWERSIPPSCMPLVYRAADRWVDRVGGRSINRLRRAHGLPPVTRILDRWWWSPDLQLGLFPDWFSIPPSELPPTMRLTGFPLADSARFVDPQLSGQLSAMLQRCGGRRPLVFAPGTAHHHARKFLHAANEVCHRLQQPGILISTEPSQLPSLLADGVHTADYLPFSELLPQAAAIIHHGGVGTTSQALRAGIPQLVLPMAFDQFDNAERVARLGCGSWLPMRKLSTARLQRLIATLPQSAGGTEQAARRVAQQPDFASQVLASITKHLS